jgi:hypothetical protein
VHESPLDTQSNDRFQPYQSAPPTFRKRAASIAGIARYDHSAPAKSLMLQSIAQSPGIMLSNFLPLEKHRIFIRQ